VDRAINSIEAAENRVWNAFFALVGNPDNEVFVTDADRALLELDELLGHEHADHERQDHG
jgi:hypothetical protein